jgi:hypothetical protein
MSAAVPVHAHRHEAMILSPDKLSELFSASPGLSVVIAPPSPGAELIVFSGISFFTHPPL